MGELRKLFVAASFIALTSISTALAAPVTSTGVGVLGTPELNWTAVNAADARTLLPLTIVADECCFGGAWVNPCLLYTSPSPRD